ncbi:PepSY-associated TM helix domain-containing protein [Methylophaga nitratireducenticrescens]|uniref:Iron-regulated membrane protein n=1 Tax=Methylophaga nitratireducenticrescens TaxID=754476 RepID=I1XJH5_METNJ|nr:PepSY-associated TM helix domain-containing protein [Methylophaga nitratireducenticrescens]AFI84544.1 PepSY domain-containing protein [Methylophaga nitratireducenticrescens]AUZ84566.1 PepSY domain-containing protein [Methylophaga nitratireducenticrescens]
MKVKADIIRIYKILHTWVGIISGMALFIAFYAGALTIFKESITHWATPPHSEVEASQLQDVSGLIARIIEAEPSAADTVLLNLYPDKYHTHQLMWINQDENAGDHDVSTNRYYTGRLDKKDQLLTEEVHPVPVAEFIDTLHRVVGLPVDSDTNRWIMGVFATLYTLALVSGLVILLPNLVKVFFAFRLGRKPKHVWLDAHNVVGVSSLPFHIIMALTAFVFAYHDLLYDAQDNVIHDGQLRQALFASAPKPNPLQSTDPSVMLSPESLLDIAQTASPSFEPYQLEYVGITTPKASVRIWGYDDYALAPRTPGGFIAINPYTGEVQSTDYLPGENNDMIVVNSLFALHFATFGGSPIRWVYFILGLAGAWLFYTGNLLWVENRRKRIKADDALCSQRKDTRVMASLTVGICLGCVCGISLMLASSKWLSLQSQAVFSSYQWIYYLMFFAALFWAFIRGAARSLVDLLWVAALTTLTIPATSLLAFILPDSGLWAHTEPSTIMVDVTALLMAIGFVFLARATSRRVYQSGAIDSVWSYQPKGA